jgi:hypothetical protein
MLNRREFLKLSGVLAAGAVVALSSAGEILAWNKQPPARPIMRLYGHNKSGCAFRPELVDLWAGGGASIPDML